MPKIGDTTGSNVIFMNRYRSERTIGTPEEKRSSAPDRQRAGKVYRPPDIYRPLESSEVHRVITPPLVPSVYRYEVKIFAGDRGGSGEKGRVGRVGSFTSKGSPTDMPPPTGTDTPEPDFESLSQLWRDVQIGHGDDEVSHKRARIAHGRFQEALDGVQRIFKAWHEETYLFVAKHAAYRRGYIGSDDEIREAWDGGNLVDDPIEHTSPYEGILLDRLARLEPALEVRVDDLNYHVIVLASHIIENISPRRVTKAVSRQAGGLERAVQEFLSQTREHRERTGVVFAVQRAINALPQERQQGVALWVGRKMCDMVNVANTPSNIAILRMFEKLVPVLRGRSLIPSDEVRPEIIQMDQTFIRIASEGETKELKYLAMDVHEAFKFYFPREYITPAPGEQVLTERDMEDVSPVNEFSNAGCSTLMPGYNSVPVNGLNGFFFPPPGKITPK